MKYSFSILAALVFLTSPAFAQGTTAADPEARLAACLQRAEALPDQTKVEADAWLKKGGGDRAQLCRAYAQLHRGDYVSAAQGFLFLAQKRPKTDHVQRAKLLEQAGLAYMQAHEAGHAESSFAAALKETPGQGDLLYDRANARAAGDKLWEALDDLKLVLKKEPERVDALRLSGHTWIKLGYESKGKADLLLAEQLATGGDPRDKKQDKSAP